MNVSIQFKWCIGFTDTQEILNFPFRRKTKTKLSPRGKPGRAGLSPGCGDSWWAALDRVSSSLQPPASRLVTQLK